MQRKGKNEGNLNKKTTKTKSKPTKINTPVFLSNAAANEINQINQ